MKHEHIIAGTAVGGVVTASAVVEKLLGAPAESGHGVATAIAPMRAVSLG